MRSSLWTTAAAGILALACSGRTPAGGAVPSPALGSGPQPTAASKPRTRLTAFGSEAELTAFLRELAQETGRRQRLEAQNSGLGYLSPAAPAAKAAAYDESVTNVQHAGVDEGGIVKVHGDHLVVLRRGRLFTIRIGGDSLQPVSAVDAFGPDVDPQGAWYDEMLVSDGTIVVVGYSYQRTGTELGVFDLDGDGVIRHRATYHLRSNDYYSSRNYASRLLGRRLVFYTPLYMWGDEDQMRRSLPALRKWRRGVTDADFRPIYSARRVYRPLAMSPTMALHSVTTCDLDRPELECRSTSVMGPPGRVFYVSPTAVYVWMTDWRPRVDEEASRSLLYRLPLDGGEPRALRVAGSAVDQFSFLEEHDHLNVLVRAGAAGDGMWKAEVTGGDVALLRLPLRHFGPEVRVAGGWRYAPLPRPDGHVLQNRFVGEYVLYGTGSSWGRPDGLGRGRLFAYRFAGGKVVALDLGHPVDRIEALGSDGLVVGSDGRDLHFTPIELRGAPAVAERFTRSHASQGELRSHGFFYKPDGEGTGTLGLPVRGAGRPGYEHLFRDSAAILFLRNDGLRLRELGALQPQPEMAAADGCRASCVDWYGNARPLFLRGRLFALLGYELVEGSVDDDRVTERRRVSFAPAPALVSR